MKLWRSRFETSLDFTPHQNCCRLSSHLTALLFGGDCVPNAAHETLAAAQADGRFETLTLVTQNIDGLHQVAGAENVIELHGSIWQTRCLSCGAKRNLRDIPEDERPPVCFECADSMRPGVILFGEAMPMQSVYNAQDAARECDVCLVIGTSALVYPAAELPLITKQAGATLIEINPEETALTGQTDFSLRGAAGEILPLIFAENSPANNRLPDEAAIKSAVDQNKNENQIESKEAFQSSAPSSENAKELNDNSKTSESHPLRVDFLQSEEFPVLNNLGMTFAPGKKQKGAMTGNWNRRMYLDMLRLVLCSAWFTANFAYMRWLETQGEKINDLWIKSAVYDVQSYLRDLPQLNSRRAPGNS